MNKDLKTFFQNRPQLILRLLLFTWVITKWICFPLWLADRNFPTAPLWDGLLNLPLYWHAVLFYFSLVLMLVYIIFPNKKIITILLLLEILSCLLDQNRWQPWEYQFIFMLAAYVFLKTEAHIYTAWQIILVGLYFFSGLSKLNAAFIHDIWYNVILRRWLHIITDNLLIVRLGYLLPLIEMGAALLLCIPRFRKPGLFILMGMHLFILVFIGPLGLNFNKVLWPWNILLFCLLPLLFYKRALIPGRSFIAKPFSWLVIACFWLLPWGHLVGRWDHYLSFTLYSGGMPQFYICSNDNATLIKLSSHLGKVTNDKIPCLFPVNTYGWALKELTVPPYPQKNTYRRLARQWIKEYPGANFHFYIYYPGFKTGVEELFP